MAAVAEVFQRVRSRAEIDSITCRDLLPLAQLVEAQSP